MKPVFEPLSVAELFSKGSSLPPIIQAQTGNAAFSSQPRIPTAGKKSNAVFWIVLSGLGLLIIGAVMTNMAQARRRIAEQTIKPKYHKNE